jgi:P2-related tail formation protein
MGNSVETWKSNYMPGRKRRLVDKAVAAHKNARGYNE